MYGRPAPDRGPPLGLPGPVPGPAHPPLHAPAPPVARLLPHPEDVAHMHRAVVTK